MVWQLLCAACQVLCAVLFIPLHCFVHPCLTRRVVFLPPPCDCSYGFVVYQDPSVVDVACAGLNGLKMGDRTLTVRRAAEVGSRQKDGLTRQAQQPWVVRVHALAHFFTGVWASSGVHLPPAAGRSCLCCLSPTACVRL